jgi:hypothetical protein
MKLYEIDQQILDCIDPETGEILDIDRLNTLQMERDIKIRNVGLWYKQVKADVKALKDEEDSFKKRRQAAENRLEGIKGWLEFALAGETFETEDKAVTIKTVKNGGLMPILFNEDVKPEDVPEEFTKIEYSYDNDAIRKALDAGELLGFAKYGERGTHLMIK